MQYLESLELESKIKFGTEIEFRGIVLSDFYNAFQHLPIVFLFNHKSKQFEFNKWCLDYDHTVSTFVKNESSTNIISGEISSKILSNEKNDWIELKQICEALKEFGAFADQYCGNHVSIDTSGIKDKLEFFKIFAKVIAVFEKEIIAFSCGEFKKLRNGHISYAMPMQEELVYKIRNHKICREDDYFTFMQKLFHQGKSSIFSNSHGINLQQIKYQNRIEFRYPNGTINPFVLQNNINFFLKIVLAIINRRIDISYLDKQIEEIDIEDLIFQNFDFGKAEMLSTWISSNETDKENFMYQFKRVI